jgi:hypothetical protein
MKCGWSDRPRQAIAPPADKPAIKQPDLSFADLQKLLGKAAEESKENMKPKYKRKDSGS